MADWNVTSQKLNQVAILMLSARGKMPTEIRHILGMSHETVYRTVARGTAEAPKKVYATPARDPETVEAISNAIKEKDSKKTVKALAREFGKPRTTMQQLVNDNLGLKSFKRMPRQALKPVDRKKSCCCKEVFKPSQEEAMWSCAFGPGRDTLLLGRDGDIRDGLLPGHGMRQCPRLHSPLWQRTPLRQSAGDCCGGRGQQEVPTHLPGGWREAECTHIHQVLAGDCLPLGHINVWKGLVAPAWWCHGAYSKCHPAILEWACPWVHPQACLAPALPRCRPHGLHCLWAFEVNAQWHPIQEQRPAEGCRGGCLIQLGPELHPKQLQEVQGQAGTDCGQQRRLDWVKIVHLGLA